MTNPRKTIEVFSPNAEKIETQSKEKIEFLSPKGSVCVCVCVCV